LDGLYAENILKNSITKMEMHFLREMVWNDVVSIKEDGETFYVTKEDKICFILSFETKN
jgi:hypothetical protein